MSNRSFLTHLLATYPEDFTVHPLDLTAPPSTGYIVGGFCPSLTLDDGWDYATKIAH